METINISVNADIDEAKKQKRKEYSKMWYERNKEKNREIMRERYANNREELNEIAKQKAREKTAKNGGRKPGRPMKKVIPPTKYVDDVVIVDDVDANIATTVAVKTDSIEDMVKELDKISALKKEIEDVESLLKLKRMELESLLNSQPAN